MSPKLCNRSAKSTVQERTVAALSVCACSPSQPNEVLGINRRALAPITTQASKSASTPSACMHLRSPAKQAHPHCPFSCPGASDAHATWPPVATSKMSESQAAGTAALLPRLAGASVGMSFAGAGLDVVTAGVVALVIVVAVTVDVAVAMAAAVAVVVTLAISVVVIDVVGAANGSGSTATIVARRRWLLPMTSAVELASCSRKSLE